MAILTYIEIDSKLLDEVISKDFPDCFDDKGSLRKLREYAISSTEKDGKALVFVGHYKYGKTSRLNETQNDEIEIWLKHFNTNLADEKTINNYRNTDI